MESDNANYYVTTLASGLRVVHLMSSGAVSYCGFMVDAGTRDELSPDCYGLAHFVEHILFKGTTRRNSWHVNNRMEAVGGELNAFTTKEDTTIYSIFLHPDFDRACELLCDLVCHSTAPEAELRKEQEVVADEIDSYLDNPSELIYDDFEEHLFAGHPLGHAILGTERSVRRFDHAACLDFIARHYLPERMVFFSYGRTPWSHVVRCVEKYYDRAAGATSAGVSVASGGAATASTASPQVSAAPQRGTTSSLPLPAVREGALSSGTSVVAMREGADTSVMATAVTPMPLRTDAEVVASPLPPGPVILERGTHQAHVMVGCRSYPLGDRRAPALALLNNLLGGPGMNSRLNLALRERRGLVYTVESSITSYTDNGVFGIYFGCDVDDVRHCLHIVQTQLRHLRERRLTSMQLRAAAKQLKGQLGVNGANLENTALALAKGIMRLGRYETLNECCRRIDGVTAEQVLEVANELWDEQRLLTLVIR